MIVPAAASRSRLYIAIVAVVGSPGAALHSAAPPSVTPPLGAAGAGAGVSSFFSLSFLPPPKRLPNIVQAVVGELRSAMLCAVAMTTTCVSATAVDARRELVQQGRPATVCAAARRSPRSLAAARVAALRSPEAGAAAQQPR